MKDSNWGISFSISFCGSCKLFIFFLVIIQYFGQFCHRDTPRAELKSHWNFNQKDKKKALFALSSKTDELKKMPDEYS
jgi:hypothetical protein